MSILNSVSSSILNPVSRNIFGDEGVAPPPILTSFIITVKTDNSGPSANNQMALPLEASGSYNAIVKYPVGGATIKTINSHLDNVITFPDGAGIKQIEIVGQLHGWRFEPGTDALKMISVDNWGTGFRLGNNTGYFFQCSNMSINATDILDLTGTTSLTNAFRSCNITYIPNVHLWDVSLVEQFAFCFYNNPNLAADFSIVGWNTASAKNFTGMFGICPLYNGVMNTLDYSGVTSISLLLASTSFDRNIDITIPNVVNALNAFSTLSTANYDSFLLNLASQSPNLKNGVSFGASGSKYSAGAAATARSFVEATHGWAFIDGGLAP